MPIPRVSGFSRVRALGIGSGDAALVLDAFGNRWVSKSDGGEGSSWEGIRGEAIGWLLSKRLGAPVPDAAAMRVAQPAEYHWLSAYIEGPIHWTPADAERAHNLAELGRTLTVDAILFNTDRHTGNILLQPDPDARRLRVWAIDMDHCLAGWPADLLAKGVSAPPPGKLARIPISSVRAEALSAAQTATTVPDADLQTMAQEACDLVDDGGSATTLANALIARSRNAILIVEEYLASIERHWNAS